MASPKPMAAAPHRTHHSSDLDLPIRRILIVDDSLPMRALVRGMLLADRSVSWEVTEASSGSEFLHLSSTLPTFDIILLDVQMPSMDGFTACRIFRGRDRQVPVIFLTAEGDRRSFDEGIGCGADSYLVKPFSPARLKAAIHVLTTLKRRAASDPAA